jgi:hypothetical protein
MGNVFPVGAAEGCDLLLSRPGKPGLSGWYRIFALK